LLTGLVSYSIAIGDFNGDGRPDIAVAGYDGNFVKLLLGNFGSSSDSDAITLNPVPIGTMIAAGGPPIQAGTAPWFVTAADFNRDGKADLAVANYVSNNVTVLLGNGKGGFTPAPGSPVSAGSAPWSMAVGDFNGDGKPDLAVANTESANVTILLGNGAGGFLAAPGSPLAVGTLPTSIVTADFNGDGKADLAVTNVPGNSVTIWLGIGGGVFAAAPGNPISAGTSPYQLTVADFNGDGKPDLAVAGSNGNITVLLGNGSGGFATAPGSPLTISGQLSSIVAADFNGDGNVDLAVSNAKTGAVAIFLGDGAGGFTLATGSGFSTGRLPYSLAVGDFNGDGNLDLAVANYQDNDVTVVLGNGAGGFTPAGGSPFAVGVNPYGVAAADFNGDGNADLASANQTSSNVSILLGSSSGTPSIAAVVNGASFQPGIAPGTWIAIFGSNMAGNPRQWTTADFTGNQLPTALDQVSVTVNGTPAYVYYISSTQVNVLAPAGTATGPVAVQLTYGGNASNKAMAAESALSPALFITPGQSYVLAVKPDFISPITPDQPAHSGDIIVLFGTGFGPTTPATPIGQTFNTAYPLTNTATATIGGVPAAVQYAGEISPGLYQFNVTVPPGPFDSVGLPNVIITLAGVSSASNAPLPVQ
jgi:uncharacterized protein (TIGR03437 family)